MSSSERIILSVIFFIVIFSSQLKAQSDKSQFIDVAIGYGISVPYDDVDIDGDGFYIQGEYVFKLAKWISLRPYAGLIFTNSDENNNPREFKVTSNAFLVGGKARITAPIPWVAPYVETGIGASLGSFETITPFRSIEKNGILIHIPVSVGFELGKKKNFDIGFIYYFHPSVEQFSGAIAFGVSIPLKNK